MPLWFSSCSNEENPTTNTATIEGTYTISALTIDPKALGLYSDLIAASKLLFSNTTCLTDLTVTFKSGGTATTNNPTSCQTIGVPVSTFTGIDATSTWAVSGNQLTVTTSTGTKTVYTIVSNSGGVVQLQWQGSLNYPTPSTTVYTYNMTLKRQ